MGILNSLLRSVTWWNGQTLNTQFYTWRYGQKVGEDEQGNIFYQSKDGKRRWVIYNGEAEASRVSVFEYLNLPLAAFWGWVLWGETLGLWAVLGMGLITLAGAMIALRAHQSAELSPTA